MKTILAAIALLWFATPATAQFMPPAKYDVPYRGTLIIHRTDSLKQTVAARGINDGFYGVAFAQYNGVPGVPTERCEIFVVNDKLLKAETERLAVVLRHELAHCNGWPADHPGMRIVSDVDRVTMPVLPPGTEWR